VTPVGLSFDIDKRRETTTHRPRPRRRLSAVCGRLAVEEGGKVKRHTKSYGEVACVRAWYTERAVSMRVITDVYRAILYRYYQLSVTCALPPSPPSYIPRIIIG